MSRNQELPHSEEELERWGKRMSKDPEKCNHKWKVVGQYPTDESVFECTKCATTRKFISEL